MDNKENKRYTLATRNVDLSALIITGSVIVLMIVWLCLTDDKKFMFIPLFFMAVLFLAFLSLIARYLIEPKIAIQADCDGIYLCQRKHKEDFIYYSAIVEVLKSGIRDKYGRITIVTETDRYQSIRTKECSDELLSKINGLLEADNKEKYLIEIAF